MSKLPPMRIMVPTNDPLRDESFNLVYRMAKIGHDVKMREFLFMPHGFLNYNAPLMGMRDEVNLTIN